VKEFNTGFKDTLNKITDASLQILLRYAFPKMPLILNSFPYKRKECS